MSDSLNLTEAAQELADALNIGDITNLPNAVCNYDSRDWFGVLCFQNVSQIQLDIVGFLAILGEGSVLASSQVASLSKMTWLPRLLPAPQALMKPTRPATLSSAKGYATGLVTGNHRDFVNFVGNALLGGEDLPKHSVRCVRITRKHRDKHVFTRIIESLNPKRRNSIRRSPPQPTSIRAGLQANSQMDAEKHMPPSISRIVKAKSLPKPDRGDVRAKAFGAPWWVAFLGCLMSLTLLGLAIWQNDGFAIVSVIVLSSLSSVVGIANKGTIVFSEPKKNKSLLKGDVIVRYPKGNFLVVECDDDIARELFFAPEEINYTMSNQSLYRLFSLIGTFLLMLGVVALGNSTTYLQIGFAVSYMILNAAYWIVAALPSKFSWDFSCFEVEDQCFNDCPSLQDNSPVAGGPLQKQRTSILPTFGQRHPKLANPSPNSYTHRRFVAENSNFTEALFRVIVATKLTNWNDLNGAAPKGRAWDQWLKEAKAEAKKVGTTTVRSLDSNGKERPMKVFTMPNWPAHRRLLEIINAHSLKEAENDSSEES